MTKDQELAHRLKLKFGTAPNEPTPLQLERIKRDISALLEQKTSISEQNWADIVRKHCPSAGTCSYSGADTSDLITLLQLVTKK